MTEKLIGLAGTFLNSIEIFHAGIRQGVEEASPFMEDLRAVRRGLSPYELGSGLLSNALDAAHTLATLWGEEQFHSPTDFALMRLMMDNAIRSTWLTAPASSDARLQRAWRVACDSPHRAKRGAEAALKRPLPESDRKKYLSTAKDTKAILQEIDGVFRAAGVEVSSNHKAIEMNEIFADDALSSWFEEIHARRLWSLLSSMVHGELTQVAQYSLSRVDPSDERIRLHNPDPAMLASVGASVKIVLQAAVHGYLLKMSGDPMRRNRNIYSLSFITELADGVMD